MKNFKFLIMALFAVVLSAFAVPAESPPTPQIVHLNDLPVQSSALKAVKPAVIGVLSALPINRNDGKSALQNNRSALTFGAVTNNFASADELKFTNKLLTTQNVLQPPEFVRLE